MRAPAISSPSNPRPEPGQYQHERMVRVVAPDVIATLPEQRPLRIDVNGVLAGTILAVPDCPREVAAGWAFMHGFFGVDDAPDRVTVDGDRVSIMVASGEDIDRRRLEAVGWAEAQPVGGRELDREEAFTIGTADLLDVVDASWHAFRHDGADDGYVHAAAATPDRVCCVARDTDSGMAAAKIIGWMVLERELPAPPILALHGSLDRRLVDAAAWLGVEVIVTSGMPTADAFRAATGTGISLLGRAISPAARLLVDAGHVAFTEPISGPV